jgi:hypothetical protein
LTATPPLSDVHVGEAGRDGQRAAQEDANGSIKVVPVFMPEDLCYEMNTIEHPTQHLTLCRSEIPA